MSSLLMKFWIVAYMVTAIISLFEKNYAREKTGGWDVWGNEVESDIEL